MPEIDIVASLPANDADVGTAIFSVTSLTPVPLNVGCETVPVGVPLTDTLPSLPVNVALYVLGTAMLPVTSLAPSPLNVGWLTVPVGVPVTDTLSAFPEKDALYALGTAMFPVTSLTAVPEKDGCDAVYVASPVLTVVFAPFVGNVPVFQEIVKSSPLTLVERLGKVPTSVIEFTVVVAPAVFTLIVGVPTVPLGVYVVVPDAAADTVAVWFVVVFVVTVTDPLGVNDPVRVDESPVNVGWLTVPLGVYVAVPVVVETVAVLFSVAFVVTVTDPLGVNDPLNVSKLPVNVG